MTLAVAMPTAAQLVLRATEKYNPRQPRDDEGQWAKDPLGLAKRIILNDGETFIASESGKIQKGRDEYGVPMALVNTPNGPRLRLGEETNSDATAWEAMTGYDVRAELDPDGIRQMRENLDVMVQEWDRHEKHARELGKRVAAAKIQERERMAKRPPTLEELKDRPGVTYGWDVTYEPPLTPDEEDLREEWSRYWGDDYFTGQLGEGVGWALRGSDVDEPGVSEKLSASIWFGKEPQPGDPQFDSRRDVRAFQKRLDDMLRLATDSRSPESLAVVMPTAAELMWRALEREYIRDAIGQFADVPGVPNVLDKLKVAGKIKLGPGEKLVSSRKIRTDDDSFDFLAAEVDTPSGRQVRLGIIGPDTSKLWAAGPDPQRKQRAEELDAQIARIENGEVSVDGDTYDQLVVEREELDEADEDYNRTAVLTPASIAELLAQLQVGAERGLAHQKAYQAFWNSPDGRRLDDLYEEHGRRLAEFRRKSAAFLTDDERRRKAEIEAGFEAEYGAEVQRLEALDPVPDTEAVFAEGYVPGGPEGDLHYRVAGYDNTEGGWDIDLGIKPPHAGDEWHIGSIADDKAVFEGARVKGLLKALQELESGTSHSPEAFHSTLGVHSMLSRALEAFSVMSPSPAVRLMMVARALEADDSFLRRGKLVHVERGARGRFGHSVGGVIADAVKAVADEHGYRAGLLSQPRSERRSWLAARLGERGSSIGERSEIVELVATGMGVDTSGVSRYSTGKKNIAQMIDLMVGSVNEQDGPSKPAARRSAVAKALASGNSLAGFDREPLRLEAKRRGLDVPHGAHIDVIRDMLHDDHNSGGSQALRDADADLPPKLDFSVGASPWEYSSPPARMPKRNFSVGGDGPIPPKGNWSVGSDPWQDRPDMPTTAAQMRKRADKLLSDMPSDQAERDRVHTEVGGLILDADRMDAAAKPARTRAKKAPADMSAVRGYLDSKQSGSDYVDIDEVTDRLKGLSHAELDEIAAERPSTAGVKGTRLAKARQIAERRYSAKNSQLAIDRGTRTEQPTATRGEADSYFSQFKTGFAASVAADRERALANKTAPEAGPARGGWTTSGSVGLNAKPSWVKPPDEPMERRRSMADSLRGTKTKPRTKTPRGDVSTAVDSLRPMVDNPQRGDRKPNRRGRPEFVRREGETPDEAAARFRREYAESPAGQREAARAAMRPRVEALADRIRSMDSAEDIVAAIKADGLPSDAVRALADEVGVGLIGSGSKAERIATLARLLATDNGKSRGGVR